MPLFEAMTNSRDDPFSIFLPKWGETSEIKNTHILMSKLKNPVVTFKWDSLFLLMLLFYIWVDHIWVLIIFENVFSLKSLNKCFHQVIWKFISLKTAFYLLLTLYFITCLFSYIIPFFLSKFGIIFCVRKNEDYFFWIFILKIQRKTNIAKAKFWFDDTIKSKYCFYFFSLQLNLLLQITESTFHPWIS